MLKKIKGVFDSIFIFLDNHRFARLFLLIMMLVLIVVTLYQLLNYQLDAYWSRNVILWDVRLLWYVLAFVVFFVLFRMIFFETVYDVLLPLAMVCTIMFFLACRYIARDVYFKIIEEEGLVEETMGRIYEIYPSSGGDGNSYCYDYHTKDNQYETGYFKREKNKKRKPKVGDKVKVFYSRAHPHCKFVRLRDD